MRATADEKTEGRGSGIGEQGLVIEGKRGQAGVVTGEGVLWLEEVQLAGKRALSIETFLRGAPGFVGSRLE
jgi:methionyl-tRNA formyltransferase